MKIFNVLLRSALFVGFAFMGSSLSCDLFDKVDDVTFDVEISHVFVIDENFDSQGSSVTYLDSDIIDPTQNDEFNKYKDKIKDLTINSVTYSVENFDPGSAGTSFTNGMGTFLASAGGASADASAVLGFTTIPGAAGTLNYTVSDLQAIAQQLKDLNSVEFQVSGTFDQTPVAFNVVVVLDCTIKADAL